MRPRAKIDVDEMMAIIDRRRRERIEARMAAFDRDRDGTVTTEELAAAHSDRFARLDHDHDGAVTMEEFAAPRRNFRRGDGDRHGRHGRHRGPGGYDRHQGYDRHGGWSHRRHPWQQ